MPEEEVHVIEETKPKKTKKPKKEKVERPEKFPICIICFIHQKLCKELNKLRFPILDKEIKEFLKNEISEFEFIDSRKGENSPYTSFEAQQYLKADPLGFLETQLLRYLNLKKKTNTIPPLDDGLCQHKHYHDIISKSKDSLEAEYEKFSEIDFTEEEEDCEIEDNI